MKIALFGYGKMGKIIESLAKEKGHEIVARFHSGQPANADEIKRAGADVAVEFSIPSLAVRHIEMCMEVGLPIVVGTTGWYNEMDRMKQLCAIKGGSMFWASNFSPGVYLFHKISVLAAGVMQKFPGYNMHIRETHHTTKLDAPSGTAITLANGLIQASGTYQRWVQEKGVKGGLYIESLRLPDVPGTHELLFTGTHDEIKLEHNAHNRMGFADGALVAAEWLLNKKGFFGMDEMMESME